MDGNRSLYNIPSTWTYVRVSSMNHIGPPFNSMTTVPSDPRCEIFNLEMQVMYDYSDRTSKQNVPVLHRPVCRPSHMQILIVYLSCASIEEISSLISAWRSETTLEGDTCSIALDEKRSRHHLSLMSALYEKRMDHLVICFEMGGIGLDECLRVHVTHTLRSHTGPLTPLTHYPHFRPKDRTTHFTARRPVRFVTSRVTLSHPDNSNSNLKAALLDCILRLVGLVFDPKSYSTSCRTAIFCSRIPRHHA